MVELGAGNPFGSDINFDELNEDVSRFAGSRLMHSGVGTTTATSVAEIDTHTFNADDFAAGDTVYVILATLDKSTGGTGDFKVRVADSAATQDGNKTCAQNETRMGHLEISQDLQTNTSVAARGWEGRNTAISYYSLPVGALNDANWLTTAWTISIRGNVNTGGTLYYKWFVYKRDHE